MGFKVVVGADIAGYEYKERLKADLQADPRVDEVIDVGVDAGQDIDYPHIGVAVARKIAAGEGDRGLIVCGTGMGIALAPCRESAPQSLTIHSLLSV